MENKHISEPIITYVRQVTGQVSLSKPEVSVFGDVYLMHKISQKGIPFTIFQKTLRLSPLQMQEWAAILGLSTKTLTRYNQSNKVFEPERSAIILDITEMLEIGMEVFGTGEKLRDWLTTDNFVLGSKTPMSLLEDAFGRELVLRELYAIDQGVFA